MCDALFLLMRLILIKDRYDRLVKDFGALHYSTNTVLLYNIQVPRVSKWMLNQKECNTGNVYAYKLYKSCTRLAQVSHDFSS